MRDSKKSVCVVLLGVVCLAACAAPANDTQATTDPAADSAAGGAGGGGRLAPEFTLPRVGGGEVSLSDGAGTIRLVDFWATWCAPCREEIPMLNELQQAYADRGFEILAISSESVGVIEEFLIDHAVEYTNLIGTEELEQEYGAVGLPTAFLIDGKGLVAEVYFGAKPRGALVNRIEELLGAS